jgi:hypothetical protein
VHKGLFYPIHPEITIIFFHKVSLHNVQMNIQSDILSLCFLINPKGLKLKVYGSYNFNRDFLSFRATKFNGG